MPTIKQRFWIGDKPDKCQLTDKPIKDKFVDGATVYGPWAIMLPETHAEYGKGLGIGRGQLYEKQADGRWLKMEG